MTIAIILTLIVSVICGLWAAWNIIKDLTEGTWDD